VAIVYTEWTRNARPNVQLVNRHHKARKKKYYMNVGLLKRGFRATAFWQLQKTHTGTSTHAHTHTYIYIYSFPYLAVWVSFSHLNLEASPFFHDSGYEYSRTPLIRTLVNRIVNYPDQLVPLGKYFLTLTVLHLFMAWIFSQLSNTNTEFILIFLYVNKHVV
jgi:hypothetical protein